MRTAVAAGEARTLRIGLSLTRSVAVLGGSTLILGVILVLGVGLGSTQVSVGDTAAILAHRLLALPIPQTWPATAETIVFDIRLPRVLTAMLVICFIRR